MHELTIQELQELKQEIQAEIEKYQFKLATCTTDISMYQNMVNTLTDKVTAIELSITQLNNV